MKIDLNDYKFDSIFWDEVNLDSVIKYFIDGYKLKDKKIIQNYEYFIDTNKNKVIIKNIIYKLKNKKEI